MQLYDVVIIGAGVVGNAIARELSRTTLSVLVLEKEADTAFGISGRNSGVIHSGILYAPGSSRAALAVVGNSMMEELCRNLCVPYSRIGKLTVASNETEIQELHTLKAQGEANGVQGLHILDHVAMDRLQPGISGIMALHSPSTAIVNPIALTIALAEHAHHHGVGYRFLSTVTGIEPSSDGIHHITVEKEGQKTVLASRIVINCAGLHACEIARTTGYNDYTVYPCRGEYYVLDKRLAHELKLLIYPVPGAHSGGLGIHLTNTTEGNILIGPSNEYITDPHECDTTTPIMELLKEEGRALLPSLETGDFIRNFSGIRPKLNPPEIGGFHDYVIHSPKEFPGIIHLLGIESPGLTAAPAIARLMLEMVREILPTTMKPNWSPTFSPEKGIYRRAYPASHYPVEDRMELLKENPDFGTIVCRCEEISKAEVVSAIKRMLGPITLVGIKQRCRTMAGRCQGGFCLPRIAHILEHEMNIPPDSQWYKGPESPLFSGYLRPSEGVTYER